MDLTHILDPLNRAQRDAVAAPPGHQLVLAGAGSGKTRVLVHRVAWLLATGEAAPWNVYVVTFTNRAAGEMRARIESILGRPLGGMWVGTFHGLAHRLLRAHCEEAGLPSGFQILDSEDQVRCIRRVLRDLSLDEKRWVPRRVQSWVNARKDEGLRARHLEARGVEEHERLVAIYRAYEDLCRRNGLVDFAELLLRTHELFRSRDDLLAHYRTRFTHLLVDEFQDTNTIQYAWLRLLSGGEGQVFAVGDDDQSIYSWRGAQAGHLDQFTRDFPAVAVYRLEQNYRSTRTILGAANALIANNHDRLGKELWTEGDTGEPISLYAAFNEVDEARFVVSRALHCVQGGMQRRDVAVLYRVSAQSRVLEEALLDAGVPYRVYGGLRFYERAEVKDALAYLRLVSNRDDDAAFERIVNTPPRGIGARTVDTLRSAARERERSLWAAARELIAAGDLGRRAAVALEGFATLIDDLESETRGLSPGEQVRAAVERGALLAHYEREGADRAQTRAENLEELAAAADQHLAPFPAEDEEEEMDPLCLLSRPCGARIRRGAGRRGRRLRAPDDPPLGEGARVPGGLPDRSRRGALPSSAQHRRTRPPGRGAPAVLRRDDPRPTAARAELRGDAPAARLGTLLSRITLRGRDTGRVRGGGAPAREGVPPALPPGTGAAPRRGVHGREACVSASASATRSSAKAWCSPSRATGVTPGCR